MLYIKEEIKVSNDDRIARKFKWKRSSGFFLLLKFLIFILTFLLATLAELLDWATFYLGCCCFAGGSCDALAPALLPEADPFETY